MGEVAARGPLLCKTMVLVILLPCATGLGVLFLVKDKSACSGLMLKLTVLLLFGLTPSYVALEIAAVLLDAKPAGGTIAGAVVVMTMGLLAPDSKVALLHLSLIHI